VGWRSPVSSVLQNVTVSPLDRESARVAYFLEFADRGLAALRKYLGMEEDPLEGVLRYVGFCVLRSGLYPSRMFDGFEISFGRNDGLDEWELRFKNKPNLEIRASSRPRDSGDDGQEAIEEVSLNLPLPEESAFKPLGRHLQQIWNFGEAIAHHGGDPRDSPLAEN
jgi:hypothetical protein